jgi:hypothetical protein
MPLERATSTGLPNPMPDTFRLRCSRRGCGFLLVTDLLTHRRGCELRRPTTSSARRTGTLAVVVSVLPPTEELTP